jgi:hypothetical protein
VTIRLKNATKLWVDRPLAEREHVRLLVTGPVRSVKERDDEVVASVVAADWELFPVCECGRAM